MTELRSLSKELKDACGIQFVTSQDFYEILRMIKLSRLMQERILFSPEIQRYCNMDIIGKILRSKNEYISIILSETLKKIVAYLQERQYKFDIQVYLSTDAYVKDWEGITILIYVNYRNFHEQMKIWREIEEDITSIIDFFRQTQFSDIEKIADVNEMIATAVEKLLKKS